MKKISCIVFLLSLLFSTLNAQEIRDVSSEVKEGKVLVSYKLVGKSYQSFNISLYVSRDNGQTFEGPMKEVNGAIGSEITTGKHSIIWDAQKEMPFVSETMIFDVRYEIIQDKPKKSFFLIYVGNPTTYFGIRAGMLGRVGFYVELRGNLMALNSGKYSYKDSIIEYNKPDYFTFTGTNGYAALSAIAGVTYQPVKNFFLYLGAGYGKEEYLMQIAEYNYEGDVKTGSSYVIYDSYANTGVEVDLGIMFRIKKIIMSAGATTINFNTYGWTAGVGISL